MEEQLTMRGGGVLTVRQDGLKVHMDAVRPPDGRGLYKVWLHSDHGGKLLLGTLAPENGQLRLHRVISVGALERAGCWPQFRAEAVLAFSFSGQGPGGWYCEQHPDQLVADPVLKGQLRGSMLCQKGEDGFSLAAPFQPDRQTPLTVLICLAQVEQWNGRPHLVWQFTAEGTPKIPHGNQNRTL